MDCFVIQIKKKLIQDHGLFYDPDETKSDKKRTICQNAPSPRICLNAPPPLPEKLDGILLIRACMEIFF